MRGKYLARDTNYPDQPLSFCRLHISIVKEVISLSWPLPPSLSRLPLSLPLSHSSDLLSSLPISLSLFLPSFSIPSSHNSLSPIKLSFSHRILALSPTSHLFLSSPLSIHLDSSSFTSSSPLFLLSLLLSSL